MSSFVVPRLRIYVFNIFYRVMHFMNLYLTYQCVCVLYNDCKTTIHRGYAVNDEKSLGCRYGLEDYVAPRTSIKKHRGRRSSKND